jgi:hypothetical protein
VRLWVGVVWGVGCHRGIEAAKLEVLMWEMITVMVEAVKRAIRLGIRSF